MPRLLLGIAAIIAGLGGFIVAIVFPDLLAHTATCPWLEGRNGDTRESEAAVAARHGKFLQQQQQQANLAVHSSESTEYDLAMFSEDDLATFDEKDQSKSVLLAVGGHVFDVSPAQAFYGSDGMRLP